VYRIQAEGVRLEQQFQTALAPSQEKYKTEVEKLTKNYEASVQKVASLINHV
jgi:hypothetical protein